MRETSMCTLADPGPGPQGMLRSLASTCSRGFSCYLSSATVARYKPSGEKHTDLRELMWTSLSSMAGSSWVWLRRKKRDKKPGEVATRHPLSSSPGRRQTALAMKRLLTHLGPHMESLGICRLTAKIRKKCIS